MCCCQLREAQCWTGWRGGGRQSQRERKRERETDRHRQTEGERERQRKREREGERMCVESRFLLPVAGSPPNWKPAVGREGGGR